MRILAVLALCALLPRPAASASAPHGRASTSGRAPEAKPSEIASSERKMSPQMRRVLPFLIVPGFLMAGVMPWIMPGIKMLVSTVAMVNQMAFTASLFALVRSYVFDTEREEHIVYVNKGYRRKAVHERLHQRVDGGQQHHHQSYR